MDTEIEHIKKKHTTSFVTKIFKQTKHLIFSDHDLITFKKDTRFEDVLTFAFKILIFHNKKVVSFNL